MDIHYLRVFASVFRNRGFTRAAEELNLSQPTVSEHIRGLEEELETRLFDRAGRQVIPTREAGLLYARALEIMERLDEVKDELGRFRDEVRGRLTIGASTIPGAYIIPPVAAEFRKKYPEVIFYVDTGDSRGITEMVLAGELLVGVVGARMARRRLDYLPLAEDELVLAAPPGLLAGGEIAPEELPAVPLLMREEGSGTRKGMEAALQDKGISPDALNVVAVLGSTEAVREAVKAGMGASILSRLALRDDIEAGRLREIRIRGVSMKRSFYVATHRRRTLPKLYRVFLECLMEAHSPGSGGSE